MRRPPVIGLAGRGGVGKSTTARALVALTGDAAVVPISTPVKAMLRGLYEAFGVDGEVIRRKLDGDLKRAPCPILGGRTPTWAMQTLGTEWGRGLIDPDLWVRWWRGEAARCVAAGVRPVNDSVRFGNEVAAIHAMGGVVVRLEGPGDLEADHVSESGVEADATVAVDGPPERVAAAVLRHAHERLQHRDGHHQEDCGPRDVDHGEHEPDGIG